MKELIVGHKYNVKFKINPDRSIYNNVYLPVIVIREHKNWYDCIVLPHINPINSYGMSKPYPMSINKFDLVRGYVVVKKYMLYGKDCWLGTYND